MDPIFPLGMNAFQHRGISVSLGMLDEALCEFEGWAAGREAHAVLYREQNRLSPRQRAAILAEVAEMRQVLGRLKQELAIQERVTDAGGQVWGRCSVLWEDLVELETKYLARYGPVPPELGPRLDPQVRELGRRLRRISDAARGIVPEDEGA